MRIIAGRWKGHRLQSPPGRSVRPTQDRVKEAWMSMIGAGVDGARVLDLYSGSGSLGLECLSRGAAHVVFVERSSRVVEVLRKNLEKLGVLEAAMTEGTRPAVGPSKAAPAGEERDDRGSRIRIVRMDVDRFLDTLSPDEGRYDLALADPPYGSGQAPRLLERFVEEPFSDEIWVEHSTREALSGYAGLESRRYGDTTVSWMRAPDVPRASDSPRG